MKQRELVKQEMAGYRAGAGAGDHRTPMAWQHRDLNIAEAGHRHRDQTPPARHGGYTHGHGGHARHSVSPGRTSHRSHGGHRGGEAEHAAPPGLRTPGSSHSRSVSRSRGHSRERSHGRENRGYSRSGTSPSSTENTGTEDTTETESHTLDTQDREDSEYRGPGHQQQM